MKLKYRLFFNKLIIKGFRKKIMKQQKDLMEYEHLMMHGDLNEEYECRDDVFYEKIVSAEIAKINALSAGRRQQ